MDWKRKQEEIEKEKGKGCEITATDPETFWLSMEVYPLPDIILTALEISRERKRRRALSFRHARRL
jgi:hypothetical protein